MDKKFKCDYCERNLTEDYRNGWEPERNVCHSCMDEVRYLRREFEKEWASYSDEYKAALFAQAEEGENNV